MSALTTAVLESVEARNEAFALEHDIDEYYTRSSALIRWVESGRLRVIRRMVAAKPGARILEVGCGGGHVLRLFPQAQLTGVDVSGRMLDKARRNLAGYSLRLFKGELHELNLPAASFDAVVCTEVLEHTVDPSRVLAGIARLLRPAGRAVVTFPNDRLIHGIKAFLSRSRLDRLPVCGRIAWGGDDYHLHVWRIAEMRRLVAASFTIQSEAFVPLSLFPIRCCFLLRSRL
jgi:ubiquinone/menaquinone biosynthesis C-methylase UbiE